MGKIVTYSVGALNLTGWMDSTIAEPNPNTNYGNSVGLQIQGEKDSEGRATIRFKLPSELVTAAILKNIKLYLYKYSHLGATDSRIFQLKEINQDFIEGDGSAGSGVTWNKYDGVSSWSVGGSDIGVFIDSKTIGDGIGWYNWDMEKYIAYKDIKWKSNIVLILKDIGGVGLAGNGSLFASKEYDTAYQRPKIEITYEDPSPTKIIDLKIIPNPDNHTQPKLTWTHNEDKDFVQYRIYRKTSSGVTVADTHIVDIADQGVESYIDTTATSMNVNYFYAIFIEDANNTGADATKSNETFFVRPSCSVSGTASKTVWSTLTIPTGGEITFSTLGGTANLYYYEWGDGGTAESTSASRTHIYTKTGTFYFKMWIENTDGFRSDTSDITHTVTVTGIPPVGVIKVSPILAEPCQSVYVNASESYARASNLSLSNYYFSLSDSGYTDNGTNPIKEYKFTDTVSTPKNIWMYVKDTGGVTSIHVSYAITVSPANIYCLNLINPVETVGRDKKRIHSIISRLGAEGQDIIGTGSSNEILRLKGIINADKNADEWDTLWMLSRGNYLVDYRQPSYTNYNEVLRGYLINFSDNRVGGETGIKAYWDADFIIKKRMIATTLTGCVFIANATGAYYDIPASCYPVADSNSDGVVNASLSCGQYDAIITNRTLKNIETDANYEYRRVRITITTGVTENITYFYEQV